VSGEARQHRTIILHVLEHIETYDGVDLPPSQVPDLVVEIEEPDLDVGLAAEALAQVGEVGRMMVGEHDGHAPRDQVTRHHADAAPDLEDRAPEPGGDEIADPAVVPIGRLFQDEQLVDQGAIRLAEPLGLGGLLHPQLRARAKAIILVRGFR
jgi:hypothetical protein